MRKAHRPHWGSLWVSSDRVVCYCPLCLCVSHSLCRAVGWACGQRSVFGAFTSSGPLPPVVAVVFSVWQQEKPKVG